MKDNMSFAKDNWEEFEKLSISILETYLPVNSEISYSITHTPNRKAYVRLFQNIDYSNQFNGAENIHLYKPTLFH